MKNLPKLKLESFKGSELNESMMRNITGGVCPTTWTSSTCSGSDTNDDGVTKFDDGTQSSMDSCCVVSSSLYGAKDYAGPSNFLSWSQETQTAFLNSTSLTLGYAKEKGATSISLIDITH